MSGIGINRLRLRGPPELATRSVFLIEDACRTGLPDSEKLVLIRRLALGPGATAPEPGARAAEVRRAYEVATRDSRHGVDDCGGSANCVWFASRAEARRALLRRLLAGRRPSDWYWPLAVPGWRGQSLVEWLGETAAAADSDGSEADLVALVVMAVEAGAADIAVEALARAAGSSDPTIVPLSLPWARPGPEPGMTAGAGQRTASIADLPGTLAQLRMRIPAAQASRIEAVVRRVGPASRPAVLLLERLLIKVSPPIALSPVLLRELTQHYAEVLQSPDRAWIETPPDSPLSPAAPMNRETVEAESRAAEAPLPAERSDETRPGTDESRAVPQDRASGEAIDAETPAPLHDLFAERHSRAAGLWLVVPSLARMGLREWLIARPDLLAQDPGRTLLRTIAAHHRVEAEDPVLGLIVEDDGVFEPPEWAQLWRVALDRWLHRHTRIKLAKLVWRPGWLTAGDDRLIVRFPPAAADLRLRRQALDVDPGWVDWLGLSVRYNYAERAMT